jgi:RND family efflux transporter MFP subunit
VDSQKDLLEQLRIDRGRTAVAPRRPSASRLIAVVVAIALVGLGAWLAFGRGGALEVRLATVTAMPSASGSASVLDATGYVTARRIATVSSQITGQVREVLIEEGMRVTEGQVLARLVDEAPRAQVALAEAQMRQAEAQLGAIRAQLRQAESDLGRQRELAERQLTSAFALEQAGTVVDQLRAQLAAAERGVAVARDALAVARVTLDNTTIRAPFDGVVTIKAAQPGEMISPLSAGGGFTRTGIGTIVDMDSLEIEVDVNEAFINRVAAGQPATATLNAYPDWKIPARVIALIPTADRTKATVRVRVAIETKDPRILPDMGVRVAFLEEGAERPAEAAPRGVLVPAAAIVRRGGREVVYVADGEVARERTVTTGGATVGSGRQVLDGVRAGERVVLDPPETLADGAAIREARAR